MKKILGALGLLLVVAVVVLQNMRKPQETVPQPQPPIQSEAAAVTEMPQQIEVPVIPAQKVKTAQEITEASLNEVGYSLSNSVSLSVK